MVKQFSQELRREEILQPQKISEKTDFLRRLRRKDLLKDNRKSCLKRNIPFKPQKTNINDVLAISNKQALPQKYDQTEKEIHSYKVALENTKTVLRQLEEMKIKNERPADYLVEMYKSDKQMFKVRRHLTEKQEKIKEKMQGKDWESKTKRREKAQKKAEAKRARKKNKLAVKRNTQVGKPKMEKQNGKRKVKRIKK